MVQADRIAALFESIVSGRLSRRQALQRAGALGLGVAASTVPGRLGGPTNGALAQEGGEIIVGVSQESVNFNPLLYTNTGPDTLPDVLMFDSLMKITPEGTFVPNLAAEVPTKENGGISEDGLTWTFTSARRRQVARRRAVQLPRRPVHLGDDHEPGRGRALPHRPRQGRVRRDTRRVDRRHDLEGAIRSLPAPLDGWGDVHHPGSHPR